MPKRRMKELGINEGEDSRYVHRLSRELEDAGSLDRLALGERGIVSAASLLIFTHYQGCFEHYTTLRHADATLDRHERASDWLMTFDSFSGTMRSEREYGLLPYLSYTLVPFYPLFNERSSAKPEHPKVDWEVRAKLLLS